MFDSDVVDLNFSPLYSSAMRPTTLADFPFNKNGLLKKYY